MKRLDKFLIELENCPAEELCDKFDLRGNYLIYLNGDGDKILNDFSQNNNYKSEDGFLRHKEDADLLITKIKDRRSPYSPPKEYAGENVPSFGVVKYNIDLLICWASTTPDDEYGPEKAIRSVILDIGRYAIQNNFSAFINGHVYNHDESKKAFHIPELENG